MTSAYTRRYRKKSRKIHIEALFSEIKLLHCDTVPLSLFRLSLFHLNITLYKMKLSFSDTLFEKQIEHLELQKNTPICYFLIL